MIPDLDYLSIGLIVKLKSMPDWTPNDIIELWNERIAVALHDSNLWERIGVNRWENLTEDSIEMLKIKHDAYFGMRRLLPSGIAVPKEIQDAVKAWKQSREYRAEISGRQGELF